MSWLASRLNAKREAGPVQAAKSGFSAKLYCCSVLYVV